MPPGLLIYMAISRFGFSDSRNRSCARDQARQAVLDAAGHENDPLLQQAREDVERAFAAAGLLDHHRNEVDVSCDWIERRHGGLSGSARNRSSARGTSYLTPWPSAASPERARRALFRSLVFGLFGFLAFLAFFAAAARRRRLRRLRRTASSRLTFWFVTLISSRM